MMIKGFVCRDSVTTALLYNLLFCINKYLVESARIYVVGAELHCVGLGACCYS